MLRFNKDMWSEESVQNIIDRKKAEVRARQEAAKRKAQEEAVRVGEDEEQCLQCSCGPYVGCGIKADKYKYIRIIYLLIPRA